MKYPVLFTDNDNAYSDLMNRYFGGYGIESMSKANKYGVSIDPTLILREGVSGSEIERLEGSQINGNNITSWFLKYGVNDNANLFEIPTESGSGFTQNTVIDENGNAIFLTSMARPDGETKRITSLSEFNISDIIDSFNDWIDDIKAMFEQYWKLILLGFAILTGIILYLLGVVTFKL